MGILRELIPKKPGGFATRKQAKNLSNGLIPGFEIDGGRLSWDECRQGAAAHGLSVIRQLRALDGT